MMDGYEQFMNSYVEFMKKYGDSDDTTSMLADYGSMMQQYSDWSKNLMTLTKARCLPMTKLTTWRSKGALRRS